MSLFLVKLYDIQRHTQLFFHTVPPVRLPDVLCPTKKVQKPKDLFRKNKENTSF